MLTEDQHILSTLAEECAEVAQRISKALRFGLNEVQPGQLLDNAERITIEVNDVLGMIDMAVARGIIPLPDLQAAERKQSQVLRFMDYAREQGALA